YCHVIGSYLYDLLLNAGCCFALRRLSCNFAWDQNSHITIVEFGHNKIFCVGQRSPSDELSRKNNSNINIAVTRLREQYAEAGLAYGHARIQVQLSILFLSILAFVNHNIYYSKRMHFFASDDVNLAISHTIYYFS
ncbi:hypothetical protein ACJX0J_012867, partial [Zea mays]